MGKLLALFITLAPLVSWVRTNLGDVGVFEAHFFGNKGPVDVRGLVGRMLQDRKEKPRFSSAGFLGRGFRSHVVYYY